MKVHPERLPEVTDPRFRLALEEVLRNYVQAINDAEHRSGTTTDRPRGDDLRTGRMYFDTTLGLPVWYDGTAWVDATGTAA